MYKIGIINLCLLLVRMRVDHGFPKLGFDRHHKGVGKLGKANGTIGTSVYMKHFVHDVIQLSSPFWSYD